MEASLPAPFVPYARRSRWWPAMTTTEVVAVAGIAVLALVYDRVFLAPRNRKRARHMSAKPIDMDKILDQREEATGHRDRFTFTLFGRDWTAVDQACADDEWLDQLQDLGEENGPVADLGEHYMGQDQYAEFVEAGGKFTYLNQAVLEHARRTSSVDENGRPTRRSNSSRSTRRR